MYDKHTANTRKIIKELYFAGTLSCAELSVLTDLSLPSAARILTELIGNGRVVETGLANSTGGRRPQTYALRPDLMYVVSIAMDQLITRFALMNMQHQIIGGIEEIELPLKSAPHSLKTLIKAIEKFIAGSGVRKDKIAGIGIGMPGFVDVNKGINHSFLKVKEGQNIVSAIESCISIPVLIDNDSSLVALAEHRLGIARYRRNVMVINVGWGVGLGMIVNGRLFRGENGFAGEFSHIPLFTNNKLCSCGKSGCLETETSLLVVAEKAIQGLKEGQVSVLKNLSLEHIEVTYKAIIDAAVQGDKFAVTLLSDAGYHIGRGIAILIHLLNPELIILSGRGAAAGRLWLAPIQQAINEHCIPKISENTTVQISSLGYQAELTGAAALIMEHYDTLKTFETKRTAKQRPVPGKRKKLGANG